MNEFEHTNMPLTFFWHPSSTAFISRVNVYETKKKFISNNLGHLHIIHKANKFRFRFRFNQI